MSTDHNTSPTPSPMPGANAEQDAATEAHAAASHFAPPTTPAPSMSAAPPTPAVPSTPSLSPSPDTSPSSTAPSPSSSVPAPAVSEVPAAPSTPADSSIPVPPTRSTTNVPQPFHASATPANTAPASAATTDNASMSNTPASAHPGLRGFTPQAPAAQSGGVTGPGAPAPAPPVTAAPAPSASGPAASAAPTSTPVAPAAASASQGNMPNSQAASPFSVPASAYTTGHYATPAAPRQGGFLKTLMAMLLTMILTLLAVMGLWYMRVDRLIQNASPAAGPSVETAPAPLPNNSNEGGVNWESVAATVSPAVVTINVTNGTSSGVGSGVIYSTDGYIITNHHVIGDAQGENGIIRVTLRDQRVYEARIVGTDPTSDLAVIRLENPPTDLTVASFGTSSDLIVGQPIMAVGAPLGLSNTVTTGIISALDRPVEVAADKRVNPDDPFGQFDSQSPTSETIITNAIQVDASINPGNSGGPLFNAAGQVIGINSSIASISEGGSDRAGSIGLGFAIPVDLVRSVSDQLVANGKVAHAILGVTIKSVAVDIDGTSHLGALVDQVSTGGAADQAGIRQDDVITHVGGKRTASSKALQGAIRQYKAGDEVTITVVRDGKSLEVHAKLQARD